ncbi:putative DNase I-like protein [Phytophthora infestans]|uniref:Putative DNase I-like protein n=1 Tax=Phytophthora infestans TaxID=4787 RepID=A0A833T552_PHYIN|nr:putative DNase I-like protein [Phytophthora infestans]
MDETQYGELHHCMATRIQALVRGCYGRAKAQRRQLEVDEEIRDEALHDLQQEGVVKIQTRTRGVLVRKKMPISDKERRRRRRRRSQLQSTSPARSVQEESDVERGVYSDPDEIGEWPQEVDLEALDDWHDLNQLVTAEESVTQTQFLAKDRLRVFCGTWNMHAKKPTDDLRLWIRLNRYHIVAVGSEECVNSIAKSVVFTSKKSWEDQLRNTLGVDYILVASHALTAIHNVVFAHTSILPLLGSIQSDAVATGLGNQLGNKGGVGIAFTVGYTSFAFVNCHFDAHQRNVSKRNGNFHRINHELKLSSSPSASLSPPNEVSVAPLTSGSPSRDGLQGLGRTSVNRFSMPSVVNGVSAGSKRTVSDLFDRVFWYGDLNYRINGTRRMVDTLLLRNQYEVLHANDQLQREMKAGNVFPHFREGQLNFRPTYKFDKRSDVYDSSSKQRIPSWTDRVLYLSNDKLHDIELLSYRSQTNFRTSDHRPVCATFQVKFSATGVAESLQSPRQSGKPDDNLVASQACSIQ